MRLFVSVRPSADASAALAAALGRRPDPKWHITLAFLGEQPSAEPFDLTLAAGSHEPFSLAIAGGLTLGRQVLAARLTGDVAALRSLAEAVQDACREAGARFEDRPFRPHLTVSRGRGVSVPTALREHQGPSWRVTGVELVVSTLGRPTTHRVLSTFPLAGMTG